MITWDSFLNIKICGPLPIYGPNIDCGCLLEPPHWGGSNKHPQPMFSAKIRKIMYTPANFFLFKLGFSLKQCSLHGLDAVM